MLCNIPHGQTNVISDLPMVMQGDYLITCPACAYNRGVIDGWEQAAKHLQEEANDSNEFFSEVLANVAEGVTY